MSVPISPQIRRAESADEEALWEMLTYAASMTEPEAVAAARGSDCLASYVRGFGTRDGDWGLVAEHAGGDRLIVAATWLRKTSGDHAVATSGEPELAIAVRPDVRGRGIGSLLLRRLLEEAPFDAIVLSVRSTNPSVRLYRRYGFETVRAITNRIGGESFVMRRSRTPVSVSMT